MGRIAILIDGGYLDRILLDDFERARIDYKALSNKIAGDKERLRTYYYHCLPYQSNPPSDDERGRFSRAQRFFDQMENWPRFQVRMGRLMPIGIGDFTQKKVDVMFAVDLVQLSTSHQISDAALITGDSDMLPAIEIAKSTGVVITLYHGRQTRPHNELYQKVLLISQ